MRWASPLLALCLAPLLAACEESKKFGNQSEPSKIHWCVSGGKVVRLDIDTPVPFGDVTSVGVTYTDSNGNTTGTPATLTPATGTTNPDGSGTWTGACLSSVPSGASVVTITITYPAPSGALVTDVGTKEL